MLKPLTDSECKDIIRRLAKIHDVEARLIVTRLMSEDDKQDMREGNLPVKSLDCHVKIWKQNGMCDYAHGKTVPLEEEKRQGVLI
jgi:hypothetical protein